jgi:hypothetical protein
MIAFIGPSIVWVERLSWSVPVGSEARDPAHTTRWSSSVFGGAVIEAQLPAEP